jgi:hypothetical protein
VHEYAVGNFAMQTTAAPVSVATANGVKTMLQVATPATRMAYVISWWYSFDVASAGIMTVELIQTDVAATVTAHVASGVQPLDPNAPASLLTLGTSATGFTATVEGSTTATRNLAAPRKIPIAAGGASDLSYSYQFMPDERPALPVSKFLRIRVTATTTTPTMLCGVVLGGC